MFVDHTKGTEKTLGTIPVDAKPFEWPLFMEFAEEIAQKRRKLGSDEVHLIKFDLERK